MKKDIFIGGAWPYANYYLHVGHLAALLPGDILARYYRGKGDNVFYVSGSDSHGTPITERAKKENTTPEKIASFYDQEFRKTFDRLEFEYDKYLNTMSPYHAKVVQAYFKEMLKNGYVYEKEDLQDYCENCKQFLSDREVVGTCPHCGGESTGDQCQECLASLNSNEVLNKKCKTCGDKTVMKPNKHLYFKLTAFEKDLQDLVNKNKNKWRKNAVGEAQKYIDMGLVDRAATRQINWGIDVPVAGYDDKRIYVWIEAVLGYMSMGRLVAEGRGINFDEFISDENKNLVTYYVHGKDNIPFHTTIFPALLLSLKRNYRLPDYIISSEYINLNNEKMSKSKGNLITANELLEKFTADTLRFYFIFNGPETRDSECSINEIIQFHNKFLVGILGNFINRNISFINKKFGGLIVEGKIDQDIIELTKTTYKSVGDLIEKGEFRNALTAIFNYISYGNKFYDEQKPWVQVKENVKDFIDTTYTCIYMIMNISNLIAPFMPASSQKIKDMLDLPKFKWDEIKPIGNIEIKNEDLLFQRIDSEKK